MRLIDADKLKAHYAWWGDERKEIFDQIVDQQPTVGPEWVPVRLGERWQQPEDGEYVLCCTEIMNGQRGVLRGYFSKDANGGGTWICGMNTHVVAWMPLPEPYEGGEDE